MGQLKKTIKNLLPDSVFAVWKHRRVHGALPNLLRPQTFNEKILHRKLFDRQPWLTQCTDKYAVRSFVAARLGTDILPELYWAGDEPSRIPFSSLPAKFVVKPTHGSGWVRLVADKSQLDSAELVRTCETWLAQSYYKMTREWCYKNIPPRIIVEEFLDDGTDNAPIDYKLFVFNGRVQMVQVDSNRFCGHRRDLYDTKWNRLDVRYNYPNSDKGLPQPLHLPEMIRAAEILASGTEFLRADFYHTGERIYLGELTTTPEAGLGRFDPAGFDLRLGALWSLPEPHKPAMPAYPVPEPA